MGGDRQVPCQAFYCGNELNFAHNPGFIVTNDSVLGVACNIMLQLFVAMQQPTAEKRMHYILDSIGIYVGRPYGWVCWFGLFYLGCSETPQVEIPDITVGEAETILRENQGVIVLDIRTAQEFARGHIAGAMHVDFRAPNFRDALVGLDADRSYIVHCASGGRSRRSLPIFGELGFRRVYHLPAGMEGWREAGLPVAR